MQNEIRPYNGSQYSVSEGATIIQELDTRTKSDLSDLDTLKKVGDEILSKKYKNVLNTLGMSLDWGKDYGTSSGTRTTVHPTGSGGSNENMLVHLLFMNLSSWDDIKDFSPKLRIERYRGQGQRGNSTKKRTAGFKFTKENPSFRPTIIPITDKSVLIDIKPEQYFKIGTGFPSKRGMTTKNLYSKQLIQFKIEITVNGVTIVSNPVQSINIIAKKGTHINVPYNVVTYTKHI